MTDRIIRTVVNGLPTIQVFDYGGELLGEATRNPRTDLWDMSVMQHDGPDSISAAHTGSAVNADLAADLIGQDAPGGSFP